ncbi:MAG: lipid A deacylase LpxR family protein [Deltaproteobacteria bacterium]|nr:lipid A deacylase LpxR family protein [Deltaproteobacteria bacterium]
MKTSLLLVVITFLSLPVFCLEFESLSGNTFNFYIENDSRNIGGPGSDQSYTNGFKLSYILSNNKQPNWAKKLTNWSDFLRKEFNKSNTNYGISLAQQIYSPSNIVNKNPNLEDRPYAGWLNLGFLVHFRTKSHSQFFSINLGVVGPAAKGEEVQNSFHRLIGTTESQGWKNQLKNEPSLQLYYQNRSRFIELFGKQKKYFDLIPYYGASIGNVLTETHLGGLLRYGINLPDDFGPTRDSAGDGDKFNSEDLNLSHGSSFYLFTGVRGLMVARNLFLDGNTYQESPRVHKHILVIESDFGTGFKLERWDVIWRFVTRSPEFKEQSYFNSFASVTISYSL